MRTRTKSEILSSWPAKSPYSYNSTQYNCNGTTTTGSGTTTALAMIVNSSIDSRITDSLGRSSSHGCLHRKYWNEIFEYTGSRFPAYSGGFGSVDYGAYSTDAGRKSAKYWADTIASWDVNSIANPLPIPPHWSINEPVVTDSSVVNDLVERAKGLKADVLLNVVEANQIWPSVKSLANCIPEMRRNWKRIRRVIRTSSGSFLAWKFGVSPILNDLANIAKFGPDMQRQFDQFRLMKNQRFSRFYASKPVFGKNPETAMANGVIASQGTYQGRATGECGVRYVLVVKPNAPKYLTEAFAKADFLMRRFSTSPASLAWEKIPFSFVLDWFVDLRGTLDTLDSLIGIEPFKVISITKSSAYDLATDTFLDSYQTCPAHAKLFSGVISRKRYKHYERSVLSRSAMPIWRPRFGKSQAGISAALIAQKLYR